MSYDIEMVYHPLMADFRSVSIARVSSAVAAIGCFAVGVTGALGMGNFDLFTIVLLVLLVVCNGILVRGHAWALYLLILVLAFAAYAVSSVSAHESLIWPIAISVVTSLVGLLRLTLLAWDWPQRLLTWAVAIVAALAGVGLSYGCDELRSRADYRRYIAERQQQEAQRRAEAAATRKRNEALRRARRDAPRDAGP